MSTSRVRAAIQRMARFQPDIDAAIQATRNRGDQAGATGVGQDDQDDRVCCDGSVNDNANPGTSQVDPGEGGQDASGGLDPDDPANLDMGAGSLTGLTDCATGEPICFEGDGFIPPDGWEEPGEPPIDDLYEEGNWWSASPSATSGYASPEQAMDAIYPAQGPYCFSSNADGYNTFVSRKADGTGYDECGYAASALYRRSCGGSTETWCTEEPRTADQWPSDGCVNLAIKSGTIVGSKYDPDQSGSYSKPLADIELCDGNGNKIGIKPSASGGWKTINATTGEDGYLYGSSGQQIAHIDGAEYSDPAI